MIPGTARRAAAALDVPVFLGVGEHDLATDHPLIPNEFPAADDITLYVLPGPAITTTSSPAGKSCGTASPAGRKREVTNMGVLDGIRVLDLSWGISGPVAGMLLADHGASVTKIVRPDGEPLPGVSGYPVWNRGKRSAVLDLTSTVDKQRLIALAGQADVLIESFEPGTADRLGIGYDTLRRVNPGLIYCDITGYGPDGPDRDRPGIDGLVAARTGQQFEGRGRTGGTIGVLSGTAGMMPGLEAPEGCWVGPDREGPLFSGVPWVSMATAYIAVIGINAAIRARGITGQGQRVSASLLQGVLATTIGGWMQVENSDAPNFETWVIDPRAPKGFFRGSDGTWMHHWVPLPEFILNASANGMQATPDVASPKDASLRVSPKAEDMVILHAFYDQLTEAVAQHPASQWVGLAAQVGVPVQSVRSPEEALLDPLLVADGCVVEVSDPQLGPIRQVGRVVELARHLQPVPAGAAPRGAHTAEVTAEADALLARGGDPPSPRSALWGTPPDPRGRLSARRLPSLRFLVPRSLHSVQAARAPFSPRPPPRPRPPPPPPPPITARLSWRIRFLGLRCWIWDWRSPGRSGRRCSRSLARG